MITIRFRAVTPKVFAYATAFGVTALFYSCDRLRPPPKAPSEIAAPFPSRDELYLFPFGRLTLSEFAVLRAGFPKVSPADLARIAMAAQWLAKTNPAKPNADLRKTTQCVRALYPPAVSEPERSAAAVYATESLGYSSLDLLRKAVDDAAGGWVVEWNPATASEFGIPILKR